MPYLLFAAMQAAAVVAAPVSCDIQADKSQSPPLLVGICGSSAVLLGSAETYDIAVNEKTGTAVALVTRPDGVKVLLVRPDSDGKAFLEIVTDDMARLAGRSPRAGLSGLTIDLSRFAEGATIAITQDGVAAKGSVSQKPGEFSAETLLADEARRRAMPKEAPRVVEVVAEGRGPEAK